MTSTMSDSKKQCFYLPVEGNDLEILRKAFSSLFNSGYKGGWLAFMIADNIRNICRWYEFTPLKPLINRDKLDFGNFIFHRLLDYRFDKNDKKIHYQLPTEGANIPLLAIYPDEKYFERLNKISHVPVMIVVPWIEKEVKGWVQENDAEMIVL